MTSPTKNPNAKASFVTGIVASGIVWLAHKQGWTIESYYATLVATGAVSAVLWLGRDIYKGGIVGLVRHVWRGVGK